MILFNLQNCLLLSLILVLIGSYGIITRRNLLLLFLCIEIILNGVHISLIAFNYFRWNGTETGHYIYMLSIAVAAVEAAVGLSMLIVLFRNAGGINAGLISKLGDRDDR